MAADTYTQLLSEALSSVGDAIAVSDVDGQSVSGAELLQQLNPQHFWQIHRSTIVNVSAIEKVKKVITGKMVVVIGNEKLPVSRAMQSQFTNLW